MRNKRALLSIFASLSLGLVSSATFAAESCSTDPTCCTSPTRCAAVDPCCAADPCSAAVTNAACCSNEYCEPWQIGASWLMMRRVVDHGPVFLTPTGDAVVLNANEFNTDYRPGFELTARGPVRGVTADIRYFQLDNLDEQSSRVLPAPVLFTGAPLGFTNPVQFAYQTDLYSAEFNLLTDETSYAVRWLAGFRYLQYNEVFSLQTPETFVASAETHNHLYGFQIGAEVNLLQSGNWDFRGVVKTGIYHASQDSQYREGTLVFINPTLDLSDKEDAAAFVGELGLTARYNISSQWSADAGYRVLWLDGIAVAGEQFSTTDFFTQSTTINQGDAFLHGFNLGLTYAW